MLLHRLFLLVMFIGMSWSEPTTNCDSMACFAPGPCIDPLDEGNIQKLILFKKTEILKDTSCEAIVKIRSYTKHHLLIIMESYKSEVTRLELNHGDDKFECILEGGKVTAKYKENLMKLIHSNASLLSCEFEVNAGTEEIFKENNVVAKLIPTLPSSPTPQEYLMYREDFYVAKVRPTCDPKNVKTDYVASAETKTATKVDASLAVLKCDFGHQLMFHKDGESKFMQASSIACDRNIASEYGYKPTLTSSDPHDLILGTFTAQCEATTCKLCDASMAPSTTAGPILETYKEGECTLLRCAKGRMKIDSRDPQDASAKCENENNTPVWKLNGETIKKDSTITCIEKLDCTATDAKNLCPSCLFKTDNLPVCLSSKRLMLEGETAEIAVFCNNVQGKFQLKDVGNGNEFFPGPEKKLVCVDNVTQPISPQTSKASSPMDTLIYVFAAIVVIGLIVGAVVGYRFYMKKKQRKAAPSTDLKTAKENKSKESKSKESKSMNESKKDETPAESKKTPETPAAAPKSADPAKQFFDDGPLREEGMTEWGCHARMMTSGDAPSKRNEESVRRKGKKGKKNGGKQQETETEKETEVHKERVKVMEGLLEEVKKEKDDLMKGKNLDVTQPSGGQSEGKSESKTGGKDKPTAVIPEKPVGK